jgi:hypothetical protein
LDRNGQQLFVLKEIAGEGFVSLWASSASIHISPWIFREICTRDASPSIEYHSFHLVTVVHHSLHLPHDCSEFHLQFLQYREAIVSPFSGIVSEDELLQFTVVGVCAGDDLPHDTADVDRLLWRRILKHSKMAGRQDRENASQEREQIDKVVVVGLARAA